MDIGKDVFTSLFGPFKFFCMAILVFPVCCKPKRGSKKYKELKRYKNGSKRYFEEMDIVKILRTNRISKMVFRSTLEPEDRLLLQIQRSQVISSDSSDEVLTDNADTIAQMDHEDEPMVRMFALGKVTKLMRKY